MRPMITISLSQMLHCVLGQKRHNGGAVPVYEGQSVRGKIAH